MIHFWVGLLFCLIFVSPAFSNSEIRSHESVEIELPIYFYDHKSSYKLKNKLGIAGRFSDSVFGSVEISTLSVEFQNVPDPSVRQYLNVIYDENSQPSHVQIASFICSGELPLGADALSIKLHKLKDKNLENESEEVFISSGLAGEDIQINQTKKNKSKIFDTFLSLVESKGLEMGINHFEPDIFVPNLLMTIVDSDERKMLTSFFNMTSSSVNGCTTEFGILMSSYKLDNLDKKKLFKEIEVSKKIPTSSQYIIKWEI